MAGVAAGRPVGDTFPVVPSFSQRLVVLAAVALLAAVTAVAVVERSTRASTPLGLASAAAPGGWNRVFAGSRGAVGDAERTSCGQVLTGRSLGVTQPVLPCGAKIVLRADGKQVLTEVIDNKLVETSHQLEVTARLAKLLGLQGSQEIEWRFATAAGG
jgi:hypothetical protein